MELNIRYERERHGWTQEYLGQQAGVTKTTIHDIETGRRKPSFEVLILLLKAFNKPYYEDIVWLFGVADDASGTDK